MAAPAAETNGHSAEASAPSAEPATLADTKALVDRLKAQAATIDERRDKHLKSKPSNGKRSAAEVNEIIRQRQAQMEHSSLSVKEEKAALQEMKRMKADAQRYLDWESEMDVIKHKRAACTEQLRVAYEALDEQRALAFRSEAASTLQLGVEELSESRLPVSEEMQELLSSLLWKRKLASECGVVYKLDRGPKRGVIVAGSADAVDKAKALIEGIGPVAVLKKTLDEEQQGLLIGKRGSTIAQLQEETGCSLEIRKGSGQVTIAGPSARVRTTEGMIDELLRDQRRVEILLKFDAEQKGTLLGKGGSTINRIQQESNGASMEVSKGDECTIRIWGPSHAVARARASLVALLFLDAKAIQIVEVPAELLEAVIGKGGVSVRKLEEAHGVRVDSARPADRSEPSKLKFRGSKEGVAAAVAAVSAVIEREKKVEEVVHVESQHIGLLLGKSGATINAISQESGAVLDVAKRAAAPASSENGGDGAGAAAAKGKKGDKAGGGGAAKVECQAVTVRGNRAAVTKALAALEAVLQYQAECTEEVTLDPRMMPLLIGRGGEEINRIRLETGCAIDGERYDKDKAKDKGGGDGEKPPGGTLKLRGSKAAVAKARELIKLSIEANTLVTESCVLPWHAIDMLIGPNGERLRSLESTHGVSIVLPGQDIMSESVGALPGAGLSSIAALLTLRGRKKCVAAAAAAVEELGLTYYVEELPLSSADVDVLCSLCLHDEKLLGGLEAKWSVVIDFAPREGTLTLRGEGSVEARRAIKQLIASESAGEELVECPSAQFDYLVEDAGAMPQLAQLCAPCMLALVEYPPAVCLRAPQRLLADAAALAKEWVAEHAPSTRTQLVPPEVVAILKPQLKGKGAEWRVGLSLLGSAEAGAPKGSMTLQMAGPSKLVKLASEAASAIVRQHAHVEERLVLSAGEYALVLLLLSKRAEAANHGRQNGHSRAPHGSGGSAAAAGAANGVGGAAAGAASPSPASFFEGVEPTLEGGDEMAGKPALPGSDGQLVLRGTAGPVGASKAAVEALLIEAERSSVTQPLTSAQAGRLTARNPRTGETLQRRLQDAHLVALRIDRTAGTLQLVGGAEGVGKVETILEKELDVDEHVREVSERLVPIIIGKGGANIKKLIADSGAQIDLDRATRKLTVRGRTATVAKGVAMLDELVGEFGEEEMAVPSRQLGLLIGRGGSTIKQLQADSGATIDIRKEENLVRVRGSAAAVAKGMGLIRELLAEANGTSKPAAAAADGSAPPPGLGGGSKPAAPPGLANGASPPGL